ILQEPFPEVPMMSRSIVLSGVLAGLVFAVSPLSAQVRPTTWQNESVTPAATALAASVAGQKTRVGRAGRPLLRTAATVLASAGAFAYAQDRQQGDPDDLLVPMAAGLAAGAVTGVLSSSAPPA